MDLRHLTYFVSVADLGTVSAAAERLHTTQPSISRQIRDLEEELGIALFERIGRRLHLTGEGEDLLAKARDVLNEAEGFRERAGRLRDGDIGVLRIGATAQIIERLFPVLLQRFEKKRPGVSVRLVEGNTTSLNEKLREGDVHLALTAYQTEWRLSSHTLGIAPIIAVAKEALGRSGKPLAISALENHPLLLLDKGFGSRDLFDAACRVEHLNQNVYLESSAARSLLALAQAGRGVAILPATVSPGNGKLFCYSIVQRNKVLELPFAVHWNPERYLAPYVKEFVSELAEVARVQFAKAKGPWSIRAP